MLQYPMATGKKRMSGCADLRMSQWVTLYFTSYTLLLTLLLILTPYLTLILTLTLIPALIQTQHPQIRRSAFNQSPYPFAAVRRHYL